jgi:cytochrome P450
VRAWPVRPAHDSPLAFLQGLAACGDVVPFTIGKHNALLLSDPRHIERVLGGDDTLFAKGPAFTRARRLLGSGLLTADRDVHRQRRPVLQRAFHRGPMQRYGALIVQRAAQTSALWTGAVLIDIAAEMHRLTLAVTSQALFGEDLSERQASDLHWAVTAVASDDPLVSLLAPARRRSAAEGILRSFVAHLVERRRQSPESPEDLLGILMSLAPEGHPAAVRQLYDDVLTMLLAGHDTIANALTWTWLLLARHSQCEQRLHAELAGVLNGRLPDAGDLERLRFTRAVLAESLRLFPPAALLTRIALKDFELDTATIPAGWLVVVSQYVVHRDARFFADPLAFSPDRWLPSPGRPPVSKLAYFPFGTGPRACLGEGFAWMEGSLVLAVLAERWRVRPVAPDAIETETRVTLRPKGPVWARLEPRGQPDVQG